MTFFINSELFLIKKVTGLKIAGRITITAGRILILAGAIFKNAE